MSDWQIGDLAAKAEGPCRVIPKGTVCEVVGTYWGRNTDGTQSVGLQLRGWNPRGGYQGFDSRNFRKIRPDEQEACEPEFITLLKRSKVPETASDWLIRVGPLAKQLNEQSRKDPRDGSEDRNSLPTN